MGESTEMRKWSWSNMLPKKQKNPAYTEQLKIYKKELEEYKIQKSQWKDLKEKWDKEENEEKEKKLLLQLKKKYPNVEV